MIQWKLNIYILLILFSYLLLYTNCRIDLEDEFKKKDEYYKDKALEPGKIQMKYLKDQNRDPFTFKGDGINCDLLVNIYSLSCNVESSFNGRSFSSLKLNANMFSGRIKKDLINSSEIIMKEKVYLINGNPKYKDKKNCPLIINTIDRSNLTLFVEENEPTILYFDKDNLETINLSYNISKNTSFLALSFSFNEVSKFNINIKDIIDTTISNSTTIFLDSDSLKKIKDDNLYIKIEQNENSYPSFLNFQIIKPNSIYILQRNYINKGFITSNSSKQYYYMEVFEEEGEIMLHNKRNNGKLFGLIKPKNEVKYPFNMSEYLTEDKDNKLEFNEHTQKLSFNSGHTKDCKKGCYLLLTYKNENIDNANPLIGYEYTLFARIWDVEDFSPQIINIPLNEYIFGTFEDNSFINHYYTLSIPEGIKEMFIQIESNYIEGFIGEGKKKLITFKNTENNLNLTNEETIIKFEKVKLEYFISKKVLSLAFRAKNFFEDIFSFYHFRILVLKENDIKLIYPLDSNIGNICLPEKYETKDKYYYCYALLSNNYNEFNLKFSVSTSNQKDNYKIAVHKNNSEDENNFTKLYISELEKVKDLQSILFEFEFEDNKPKTILSMFTNDKDISSPKFYSSQIYILFNSSKEFNFNFNYENCLLIFKFISGSGTISSGGYSKIEANSNNFGKPITIPISKVKKIIFKSEESFIYHLDLKYVNPKSGTRELIVGESLNEILLDTQFPIYYYLKIGNQDNIDINFRIINLEKGNITTNIFINGYMIDNEALERKLNGEFIELTESIKGQYDQIFKNGILQINETIINKFVKNINSKDNKKEYILIKIDGEHYIENDLSIEIIAMSNDKGYYLVPVNQYIMGYSAFNNTKYLIKNNLIDNNTNDIIIEFSPNYKEINLAFDNLTESPTYKDDITTGIQKYLINTDNNKEILLNINRPEGISNGNYLFKYYFLKNNDEFEYKFDNSYTKAKVNAKDNKEDICLKFNKFEIYNNEIKINNKINSGIIIKIFGSLFKKSKADKQYNELLNTSAFISSEPSYKNNTDYKDNNSFELCFMNMNKTYFIFDLQIKFNIIFNEYFFKEDSFVYTLPIDLTNELEDSVIKDYLNKNKYLLITILIVIILMLIFIFLYIKMKKRNKNLENQVSLFSRSSEEQELYSEYSNDKDKNSDIDDENAFI